MRGGSDKNREGRRIVRGLLRRFIGDYIERHRYAPNIVLHIIGIPLLVVSVFLAWRGRWLWAVWALAGSYLLQTLGHWLQGSEVGELGLIRRLVGLKRPEKGR